MRRPPACRWTGALCRPARRRRPAGPHAKRLPRRLCRGDVLLASGPPRRGVAAAHSLRCMSGSSRRAGASRPPREHPEHQAARGGGHPWSSPAGSRRLCLSRWWGKTVRKSCVKPSCSHSCDQWWSPSLPLRSALSPQELSLTLSALPRALLLPLTTSPCICHSISFPSPNPVPPCRLFPFAPLLPVCT